MTILNFPDKQKEIDRRTPAGALETVLDEIRKGEIAPETMIITWSEVDNEEGSFSHQYLIAGGRNISDAVGLIEITKSRLLE